MKKILLLVSLLVLLTSCLEKTELSNQESVNDGVVPVEVVEDEGTVLPGNETDSLVEPTDTTANEGGNEPVIETPEEKEVELETPVIKTEKLKEETSPGLIEPIHEETTEMKDEEADELIEDMIGDIDDIFKEIESEG